MAGAPATWALRAPTWRRRAAAGTETNCSFSAARRPRSWSSSASPTQTGSDALSCFGWSEPCAPAARSGAHVPQLAPRRRVRTSTPCACAPMSWKRRGACSTRPKSPGLTSSENPRAARAWADGRRGRSSRPVPAAALMASARRRVSAAGGTRLRVAAGAIAPRNRDCGREFRCARRLGQCGDGGNGLGLSRRAIAGGAEPFAAVGAHRVDDRQQRLALRSQRVLDARWDLGVGVALDDPLLLEGAQAQAQRAGADAGERALELAEAGAALREVAHQEERPLAADDLGSGADGTGLVHTPKTLPNEALSR